MAAVKRTKKQSLPEFRAWLEGVEELQPEGWAPNAVQWKLIRNRINGIKEEMKVVERASKETNIPTPYNNSNTPSLRLPTSMIPPAPQVDGVPAGNVKMAASADQMFNPQGGKSLTPNIDTSDGNVTSSFE